MKENHKYITYTPLLVALLLACLLAIGCSKVNQENYNQLKVGMTYSEVTALIGNPSNCDAVMSVQNCIWQDGRKQINVNFVAEKAVLLSSQNLN
jgi:hypothetical protein